LLIISLIGKSKRTQTLKTNAFFFYPMPEFQYELKIPKERIAVLIGTNAEVKSKIESETKTEITVDSKEGDVFVRGEDALSLYSSREIIRAIGRGFNPNTAMLLLKQDYCFELIPISIAKTKKGIKRLKGRVIGSQGKSRKLIEELTETYISVYGKTIGIIGRVENTAIARRAVDSLLKGSPHSSVYKWLEKQKRETKKREILGGLSGK